MRTVTPANRYGDMGSLGDARNKLICQYQFPHEYDPKLDRIISFDHDRLYEQDYERTSAIFNKYLGTGGNYLTMLAYWLEDGRITHKKILEMIKELLEADPTIEWTGYRILGTVNRSNGAPVHSLQLFAKGKDSKTKVYTGNKAPNVENPNDNKFTW